MLVKLDKISIEGTQSRASLNNDVVNDYAELMRCGKKFPAVKLFYDGSTYWLADGFHRYFATKLILENEIEAESINGSKDEAILFSISANNEHGLMRTNADKRHAVLMILNHKEWKNWTNRAVALEVGVSHELVNKLRKELDAVKPDLVATVATTPTPMLDVAIEKQENPLKKEEFHIDDYAPSQSEIEEVEAHNKAKELLLETLTESDAAFADVSAKLVQVQAMNIVLESRNNGLMNENAALSKIIKARDRTIAKLQAK